MKVLSSFFFSCVAAILDLIDLIPSAAQLPQRVLVKVAATGNAKRK
jgi:hypothetical protein